MIQLIDQELMQLSPDNRAVLILRHFADQSLREIGYILSVPEKTVKSRLFSAREQLRVRLVQK
jgi:RNA polymerase sigma-70 factor (ECF subfamily)